MTEDDFTVMIFDGATDWNSDGDLTNDKQIVDTYLSGLNFDYLLLNLALIY